MFGMGVFELIILAVIFVVIGGAVAAVSFIAISLAGKSTRKNRPFYCSACGQKNDGIASQCTKCGYPLKSV
jgi:hypothetical protein